MSPPLLSLDYGKFSSGVKEKGSGQRKPSAQNRIMSHKPGSRTKGGLLLVFVSLLSACQPKGLPPESFQKESVLGKDSKEPFRILGHKSIQLDETPSLESLVLSQSKQSETLAAYGQSNGEWVLLWKETFHLTTLGGYNYNSNRGEWSPSEDRPTTKDSFRGDCIQRIVLAELPGDSYNSVFLEILSEEPPLGLFSIPLVYRKGIRILDGLALFKEHEALVSKKRADFAYNKEDKSIRIFPSQSRYTLEFVFNGWELLPKLPGQPVASFLETKSEPPLEVGKESKITLTLKNRGQSSSLIYISLSFPYGDEMRLDPDSTTSKLYPKSSSIFHLRENRRLPSEAPLIEWTKEGWGANYKLNLTFFLKPKTTKTKFLFRTTYRNYSTMDSTPNAFSIAPIEIDQQGYHTYPIPMP